MHVARGVDSGLLTGSISPFHFVSLSLSPSLALALCFFVSRTHTLSSFELREVQQLLGLPTELRRFSGEAAATAVAKTCLQKIALIGCASAGFRVESRFRGLGLSERLV